MNPFIRVLKQTHDTHQGAMRKHFYCYPFFFFGYVDARAEIFQLLTELITHK